MSTLSVSQLFGIQVHAATLTQIMDLCQQAIEKRKRLLISVVNAAKIITMRRNALLQESVAKADLVLADGMAVVWASRLLGQPVPERVAGIDLFEGLLAIADLRGYSVYFLGATREVLDSVLQRIRREYPELQIAGSHDGYFDEIEAPAIACQIGAARPDMLFVAMTSPKKEIFLDTWGPTLHACVCHGVGGSFDVFAGKVKRAPRVWQRLGLEWLYRVVQEPGRMWRRYLVTNTLFIGLLACELLFGRQERKLRAVRLSPTAERSVE